MSIRINTVAYNTQENLARKKNTVGFVHVGIAQGCLLKICFPSQLKSPDIIHVGALCTQLYNSRTTLYQI